MDRAAAIALLESQHTFPSDHRFHVIVRPAHAEEVLAAVAAHCALPHLDDRSERVPSRQGSYLSLRLTLPCTDAAFVLDTYAMLGAHPAVIRCL